MHKYCSEKQQSIRSCDRQFTRAEWNVTEIVGMWLITFVSNWSRYYAHCVSSKFPRNTCSLSHLLQFLTAGEAHWEWKFLSQTCCVFHNSCDFQKLFCRYSWDFYLLWNFLRHESLFETWNGIEWSQDELKVCIIFVITIKGNFASAADKKEGSRKMCSGRTMLNWTEFDVAAERNFAQARSERRNIKGKSLTFQEILKQKVNCFYFLGFECKYGKWRKKKHRIWFTDLISCFEVNFMPQQRLPKQRNIIKKTLNWVWKYWIWKHRTEKNWDEKT